MDWEKSKLNVEINRKLESVLNQTFCRLIQKKKMQNIGMLTQKSGWPDIVNSSSIIIYTISSEPGKYQEISDYVVTFLYKLWDQHKSLHNLL